MKIETIVKPTAPIAIAKKTILNILFSERLIAEKFKEILKPYDLSSEQFNVLRILRGQKGNPINMQTIQERMVAKTSNTTRIVDKLLQKKLVSRTICKANRRKIEVVITHDGLQLLELLEDKVINFENNLAKNLAPTDLDLLNQLLEKYRNINNE